MLFNSYIFIFLFLPLALTGYFVFNRIGKYTSAKYFLVGMSLWFYAYFNISYLWIILISIAVNYLCHLVMVSNTLKRNGLHKVSFVLGLLFDIGLLFYYKYFNFFVDNINGIFRTSIHVETILLPLGISFFTFQQIAFLVDTKRGEVIKQPLCDYMMFVSFFPQLIAGPIVSHTEMLPQFQNPELKRPMAKNLYKGSYAFVVGLSKKIFLADMFGQAVEWGYSHIPFVHGSGVALLILLYTLQIYFDFSGYCDMARGIGYMFNIQLPVNFNSPYKARNIIDFWGRWHITLTRFFTKYVYIPLGGNRRGTLRTYINILIIFIISGVWHGVGYNFIVWGMMHGVLNVCTRVFHKWKERISYPGKNSVWLGKVREVLSILLTFVCVNILWVFFRADSLSQAVTLLSQLFETGNSSGIAEMASIFVTSEMWYIFRIFNVESMAFANFLPMLFYLFLSAIIIWGCKNISETEENIKLTTVRCIGCAVLFVWSVISLSNVSVFLYFNF